MDIEVDEALQRLANNKALYVNLALSFPGDVATMTAQIRQGLTARVPSIVTPVLHNLKGVARTLGARALAEQAAALEQQLRSGEFPQDIEASCLALEALSNQTMTALEGVVAALRPAPRSAADGVFDSAALNAMLDELLPLLESSNMRALSVFAKAQYKFGALSSAGSSPRLRALTDAINHLDFQAALENCRLIKAELDAAGERSGDRLEGLPDDAP